MNEIVKLQIMLQVTEAEIEIKRIYPVISQVPETPCSVTGNQIENEKS